jgi:hypothetical protein
LSRITEGKIIRDRIRNYIPREGVVFKNCVNRARRKEITIFGLEKSWLEEQ